MITAGIVCEYNPFHNGHKYHIAKTREITGADCIIAVMSGNYVQRGEPSIISKWARTEMALMGGADIVIELPSVFAASSAEFFAKGAIDILNQCNVDYISFGSETDDLSLIENIATQKNSKEFSTKLHELMAQGKSYPAAAAEIYGTLPLKSNDILAVEYLCALKNSNSTIKPVTIKRYGNSHDEINSVNTSFASAKKIRNSVLLNESYDDYTDESTKNILNREFKLGKGPITLSLYENIILSNLRKMGPSQISKLPFISEGLEYLIYDKAQENGNVISLIEACTSTRYTNARIRRIINSVLTGVTSEIICETQHTPYIKILGLRKSFSKIIKNIKNNSDCPVFSDAGHAVKLLKGNSRILLENEKVATDNYVLGFKKNNVRLGYQEYTVPIVILP